MFDVLKIEKKNKHSDYIDFLSKIDLNGYRERFKGYKSVEEDLPKDIRILDFIYKYYWYDREFLFFDEFINLVISKIEPKLKLYNLKRNNHDVDSNLSYPLFLKGWIARQYRTWASIVTQIQFGYLYEENFPIDKVIMNTELDEKGIDVRVQGKKDFEIKKVSKRTDININFDVQKNIISIRYWTPKIEDLQSPRKKNGELKVSVKHFFENEQLDFLPNGFIIFNKKIFTNV
jgi:hypothetical protein